MTRPTASEISAYLDKLSMQASFLGDPALIEAHLFIQRLLGEPIQNNEPAASESPGHGVSKAA